jgi:hypothetical protein
MRKIISILIIMLVASVVSSGQPPDRFPPILANPAEARMLMVQGGVPVVGGNTPQWYYADGAADTAFTYDDWYGVGNWCLGSKAIPNIPTGTITKLRVLINDYNTSGSVTVYVYSSAGTLLNTGGTGISFTNTQTTRWIESGTLSIATTSGTHHIFILVPNSSMHIYSLPTTTTGTYLNGSCPASYDLTSFQDTTAIGVGMYVE